MTRWSPLALAAALALSVTAAGCGDSPEPATRSTPASAQTMNEAASGANDAVATSPAVDEVVWVDVRTPREFAAEHVEGAINIPHTEIRERHEELERFAGQRIAVYCRSGRRSGIAERILEAEGFEDVVNAGGLRDLARQGVPTTR